MSEQKVSAGGTGLANQDLSPSQLPSEGQVPGLQPTRRQVLRALGTLPAAGLAGALAGAPVQAAEQKQAAQPPARKPSGVSAGTSEAVDLDALTQPTFINQAEQGQYTRLKQLDLASPEVVAKQRLMPTGRIGKLTVSRLIAGSNLISPNMHARDLRYVQDLAAHYNTEARVLATLKMCEALGVNTIVLKDHNFRRFRLADYWTQWGGHMQWIADVITTDIKQYERRLVAHLELGAAAAYLWGGAADTWYHAQQPDKIVRAYEIMRKYDIPVGIAAHRLEPIMFCQREGLKPDFYMLTFHHDRYWSAHPPENRRFLEMYEPVSSAHDQYHDNLFCHRPEEIAAFMREVKVPWIAFKVLAAGAIHPQDGFAYAFENGADFLCVGMFDFQVAADVALVRQAVAQAQNRARPWA